MEGRLYGPKRVVLVRHGESTWNATGRIQGSSNHSELTAKGLSQAETSRVMLLGDSFDACFHSPLTRSSHTAEIIWSSRKAPMISIDDLREIDLYSFQASPSLRVAASPMDSRVSVHLSFGHLRFQGLFKEEGKAKYGEAYKMWQKDAANFEIDGHFPVRELWARAKTCWDIILSSEHESILVVAHNAVNQALVATATGNYFRKLLQSNCGVSVLDFTPRSSGDGPPYTPSPPVAAATSGGRKAKSRMILVCHGATNSTARDRFASSEDEELNMLGIIQSRKTAELLLDVEVDALVSSPLPRARRTAEAIIEVQEGAHCLSSTSEECIPRAVEMVELPDLRELDLGEWKGMPKIEASKQDRWEDQLQHHTVEGGEDLTSMWERAGRAWESSLAFLDKSNVPAVEGGSHDLHEKGRSLVVVGHELVHTAMLGHCLDLTQACVGSFHLDPGSVSVIDFPDGPTGKGVVRCLNYTAHLGRWSVPVTRPSLADEDF
eukprot:SM000243S08595  [mRNA]  locus=s243:62682:66649:- [translate_table: standard]